MLTTPPPGATVNLTLEYTSESLISKKLWLSALILDSGKITFHYIKGLD